MRIHHEVVGTTTGHPGQEPASVDAYTLDNGRGLVVTAWTYGATLVEVLAADRHGRLDNVVHRLPDLDSYLDQSKKAYVGATVGRYCRSVAHGRFRLGGVEHRLDLNEGRHHFHGGAFGFDSRVWHATPHHRADHLELRMTLDSPDGDQGYPGALSAEAVYRVDSRNRLTIEFTATTTAPTIVGLTNHAFWNLAGGGKVDGHLLTLHSRAVVEMDTELIPVQGPPSGTAGTPLDYTRPRFIDIAELDNFFVLGEPGCAAELEDPVSGRVMRVSTDQPGIGVYSADGYRERRAGICLETGSWPDAPNRPDFPPVRLDPGETYRARTVHEFSAR